MGRGVAFLIDKAYRTSILENQIIDNIYTMNEIEFLLVKMNRQWQIYLRWIYLQPS